MQEAHAPIRLVEKIGYGAGDAAFNLVWMSFIYFQMYFYTDVFGISATHAGFMLLLARVWDTVNDPIMGMLADRTKSRWGKFRPYLLYGSIPLGIVAVLSFTSPDFSPNGKLIYAYLTYMVLGIVYTAVNIPYSSLMSSITANIHERESLSTFRMVGAYSAGLIVLFFTKDLVELFGGGDEALGYQLTMMVYAVLLVALLVFCFSVTRERVKDATPSANRNMYRDLSGLLSNKPFLILFIVGIATLSFVSIRNGVTLYYMEYYLGREDLAKWLMTGAAFANIVGAAATVFLLQFAEKKKLYLILMLLNALTIAIIYLLPKDATNALFGIHYLNAFLVGPTVPIVFAMYADIVDYAEKKFDTRIAGLVFAGASFSQKMGWTLGGSALGLLLGWFNYEANVELSEQTLSGIRLMFTLIPAGLIAIAVFFMSFYDLTDDSMSEIQSQLKSL